MKNKIQTLVPSHGFLLTPQMVYTHQKNNGTDGTFDTSYK